MAHLNRWAKEMKLPFQSLFTRQVPELTEGEAIHELKSAVERDDLPKIRKIIAQFPVLLNFADEKGETPLHWAARAEKISSVGCLVDLGADTTKESKDGIPPAWCASSEIAMGALTDSCRRIHERSAAGPLK